MTGAVREPEIDIAVIGGGAAGLFAALAARGALKGPNIDASTSDITKPTVTVFDSTKRPGLKILVSGGGRCNLTNTQVDIDDFVTDAPRSLRSILASFDHVATRAWFESRHVATYEESQGKVFPTSNDAHQVLGALLNACDAAGIAIEHSCPITAIQPHQEGGFLLSSATGTWRASVVILATGGKSLPKTGSDGAGYTMATRLGHTVASLVPALVQIRLAPLSLVDGLAGLTLPARLDVADSTTTPEQRCGRKHAPWSTSAGSVLVTHDGMTGPAALDVSGAIGHALDQRASPLLFADFWSLARPGSPWPEFTQSDKAPGACLPRTQAPLPTTFEAFMNDILALAAEGGIATTLAKVLPRSLVQRILERTQVLGRKPARSAPEGEWRKIYLATCHAAFPLLGTGGYDRAEVTCGGILLGELDRRTLESTKVKGLFACGEVVNVTGRLGGFNFQWAWSSGYVAGTAARSVVLSTD